MVGKGFIEFTDTIFIDTVFTDNNPPAIALTDDNLDSSFNWQAILAQRNKRGFLVM